MTLEPGDAIILAAMLVFLGYILGANVTHRRWVRSSEESDANWRAILNAVQAGQSIDFQPPVSARRRRRLRSKERSR